MSRKQGVGKKQAKDGFSQLSQLVALGRHEDVVAAARQWLRLHPPHSYVLKVLAVGLMGLERHVEAEPVLMKALALTPGDAELHSNLGICRAAAGSHADAVEAFSRALQLAPGDAELWKNQGAAFFARKKWVDAIQALTRAIELQDEDDDLVIHMLATALMNTQSNEQAYTCFSLLAQEQPDNLEYLGSLLVLKQRLADWEGLAEKLAHFRGHGGFGIAGNLQPWYALSLPGITALESRELATACMRQQLAQFPPTEVLVRNRTGRLRIGYLSCDFRNHAVAYVLPEVLARHDRDRFEIVAYSTGDNDQSEVRRRLETLVDRFVDIAALTDAKAAATIAAEGIDILIDLQGWTSGSRPELLARRPARIIVNWLGYPGTLGDARLADFLFADPITVPVEDDGFYSETVLRFPHCYLPLDTGVCLNSSSSRRDAGLPETGFLFGSLNETYKLNPDVFDVWCEILRATPGSYLLLRAAKDAAMTNLRAAAEARGVSADRLVFLGYVATHAEFVSRLALTDLMLDPFPYNSHSTGMWSLWAGVPMVSLLGQTFAGRVGASLLTAAGLSECVAGSPEKYCEIAVSLAHDRQRLMAMRSHLENGRSSLPLFDMGRFTRDVELLLTEAAQRLAPP